MCRPTSVALGDFAKGLDGLGAGGHFEYGMDFINRVCETQIKLQASQLWPVFQMVTFLLLFFGAGVNSEFIRRYNRSHAIARGQYHSPLIGKEPLRAAEKEPGRFEAFFLKFMICKFLAIIVSAVMLAGFWYSLFSGYSEISRTTAADGTTTWSGGSPHQPRRCDVRLQRAQLRGAVRRRTGATSWARRRCTISSSWSSSRRVWSCS